MCACRSKYGLNSFWRVCAYILGPTCVCVCVFPHWVCVFVGCAISIPACCFSTGSRGWACQKCLERVDLVLLLSRPEPSLLREG